MFIILYKNLKKKEKIIKKMNPFIDNDNGIHTCIPGFIINKDPVQPIGGGFPKQEDPNPLQTQIDHILNKDPMKKDNQNVFQNINLNDVNPK